MEARGAWGWRAEELEGRGMTRYRYGLVEEATQHIYRSLEEERAQLLTTIPGIGRLLAHTLLAEIGDIKRSPSERSLSSYAGPVPTTHQSSKVARRGGLGNECNKYLRWALVEAAQVAVRCDPQFEGRYIRLKRSKGAPVALAAMAHKLAKIIYAVLMQRRRHHHFRPRPLRGGLQKPMVANK